MDSILASDNHGEVEMGSANCASGDCLQTFCKLLRNVAGQRAIRIFSFTFSGYNRVRTVQMCMAFQVVYFQCCKLLFSRVHLLALPVSFAQHINTPYRLHVFISICLSFLVSL